MNIFSYIFVFIGALLLSVSVAFGESSAINNVDVMVSSDQLTKYQADQAERNKVQSSRRKRLRNKISMATRDMVNRPKPKYQIEGASLKVNGGAAVKVKKMKSRGQSSQAAPRLSFSVKLDSKISINGIERKKWNFVGLWEDQGYVISEIGHSFYRLLDLFPMRTSYVQLRLTDGKRTSTQGVYLAMEKPDEALEDRGAQAVIRRGYFGSYELKSISEEFQPQQDEIIELFEQLADPTASRKEGEELYQWMSARFNVKAYMQWLALNYFFRNGDYDDEVSFYLVPKIDGQFYFQISAWDLDGLFSDSEHWGVRNSLKKMFRPFKDGAPEDFLYSHESKIDRVIVSDPYLRAQYYQALREVLALITPEKVDQLMAGVKDRIAPYLKPEILAMSSLDPTAEGAYSKVQIVEQVDDLRDRLKARRTEILNKLL